MRFNRCPICHCCIDIVALAKDEASSQLLAKLSRLDTLAGNALLDYMMLFTPPKSALATDRALRLVEEVEALADGDWTRLAAAMVVTVDNMRTKAKRGESVKQFKSHAYLKTVLDETQSGEQLLPSMNSAEIPPNHAAKSKTRNALEALEALKDE